ncbi:STAS domain-containing protein [Herpetosiphon giganteus]|uniref:STAS domain-containing protein n=1 Tax=Herpetosiphon giganteus TaxID=2029754 RepID=UPI0019562561|nr:anti-anti-sigma regulatory factor/multisubunit Na+/H+ antiporter MnhC subunit [Herpetosiphon giganteus]
MKRFFQQWLHSLSYSDPIQLQQAQIMQGILLGSFLASTGALVVPFLAPVTTAQSIGIAIAIGAAIMIFLGALLLLRRNYFKLALFGSVFGLSFFLLIMLLGTGLADSGAIIFGLAVPMALASLLSGRKLTFVMIGVGMVGLIVTALAEAFVPQITGFAKPMDKNYGGIIGGYMAVALVLGMVLSSYGSALSTALSSARTRQIELELLQASLEKTVAERTATLQNTLAELKQRATEQSQLLEANQQQAAVIRELGVPIIPLGGRRLVVPLVGQLDSDRLATIRERVITAVVQQRARQVLLDVTGVPLVDVYMAGELAAVIAATSLVGAETALVGINPDVAQGLVGSGIDVSRLPAFATLEQALNS